MPIKAPDPSEAVSYWLHHAASRWRAELGRRLAVLELTPTQFDVLSALGWADRTIGKPTQQNIAAHAGIDRMMTSKVLKVLIARGLAERERSAMNLAAYTVHLTALGRGVLGGATAIARAAERELFANTPDVDQLRSTLKTIRPA
jgi:DNA-binding MarR family transcriptional regulator